MKSFKSSNIQQEQSELSYRAGISSQLKSYIILVLKNIFPAWKKNAYNIPYS